jgi:hypothetical protein
MIFPEQFRVRFAPPWDSGPGDPFGCFIIPDGADRLCVIASAGTASDAPPGWPRWEHVSVSVRNRKGAPVNRCPTWGQMCRVKDLFWLPEQAAVQFHPPRSQYVNHHPNCLHLWRPLQHELILPPSEYVGPSTAIKPWP